MSSCPGTTLEEYLTWCYDIVVAGIGETNFSIGLAEALGNVKPRPRITKEQFEDIVHLFEEYRERVEDKLIDFSEEEHGSWRDYAGYNFDFIPESLDIAVAELVKKFKESPPTSKEPIVEYITKESLKSLRPFVVQPQVIRGLADSVALLTAHSHHESGPQDAFIKARISTILRDVSSRTIPSGLDYFTGNGPMARYLKEHLAIEQLMESIDGVAPERMSLIRKEIDQKFNYNPSINLTGIEWKNIIQTMIELQDKFFSEEAKANESLWKVVGPNEAITESGLYKYDVARHMINLVFNVEGVAITITIVADTDPLMNVFHEWEEQSLNLYNVCYIPGTFKAMIDEVNKLDPQ